MNNTIVCLILLLISVAIGMIIGIIFKPKDRYHGPNAKKQTKKIYYNKTTRKCFSFGIKLITCPKPKSILQKILDHMGKYDLKQ